MVAVSLLSRDVPADAVVAAAASFFAVRSILRFVFRAVPSGPRLHWNQRNEVEPCGRVLHALVGLAPAISRMESGEPHIACLKAARRALNDPQPNCVIRFGQRTRVILGNPKDVEYVLLGERSHTLTKPTLMRVLHPLLGPNGLVTIDDEDFHTQQFRAVAPAFSPLSVKNIAATTMREHFSASVKELKTLVANAGGRSCEVNVNSHLQDVTLRVISEAAFCTPELTRLRSVFTLALDSQSPLMILGGAIYNRLPTARNRACQACRDSISGIVNKVIAAARASPTPEKDKKLIDFMAENPALKPNEILDHACTFAFAGHETTSTALIWFLYFVAKHPDVQEKLAEELSEAFPAGGVAPSMDALRGLEYLNAVTSESMRVIPPVVAVIRVATEDIVLPASKTFVPKGTSLHIGMYPLHRHPHVWGPDADTFRPERWIEDPELRSRVTPCAFMPFAVGKRACIGKDFAMQEMLLGAAMLVRNFKFEWPEGQAEPIRIPSVVSRPKHPLPLRISMRT
uniref:Cytochrome P450 n=1 Tax=Neobodo designis TaxID=312471 RepID=A0A7S1L5D8_NEODS